MTARTAIIIGAGIGGLTAAATLRRVGVECEVYERASSLRPAGSALSLTINARMSLRSLGIDLDVERRAAVYRELHIRTARGRLIRTVPFGHLGDRLGAQNVAIHRADLQQALLDQVGDTPITLGATATRFETDRHGVRVGFADGREARGDVLIGADGFHSVVRSRLVGAEEPREPGYVCWLATLPYRHPVITPGFVAHYWGSGRRFGLIDIGDGRVYWWGTRNMPPALARDWTGGKAEILDTYAGWADEVLATIAATPEESIIAVPAQDRPFLERWGRGPVTLLGDAAHPMLPSLAQGAAMAIEDAAVLAHAMAGEPDPVAALRAYETDRRERTRMMVDGSNALSTSEQLDRPLPSLLRNLYMRFVPAATLDARNAATMTFGTALAGGAPVGAGRADVG
jgi:2-polyprenyl-6-methoxyphenol hydroxylase-like FAD-dependent oxidoreductase